MPEPASPSRRWLRLLALVAGPLAYLIFLRLAPASLGPDQREVHQAHVPNGVEDDAYMHVFTVGVASNPCPDKDFLK